MPSGTTVFKPYGDLCFGHVHTYVRTYVHMNICTHANHNVPVTVFLSPYITYARPLQYICDSVAVSMCPSQYACSYVHTYISLSVTVRMYVSQSVCCRMSANSTVHAYVRRYMHCLCVSVCRTNPHCPAKTRLELNVLLGHAVAVGLCPVVYVHTYVCTYIGQATVWCFSMQHKGACLMPLN